MSEPEKGWQPPPVGADWCSSCGCGNDARGYAHLSTCPEKPAEVLAEHLEQARKLLYLRPGVSAPAWIIERMAQGIAEARAQEREVCLGIAHAVADEQLPEPYFDNARSRRMDWASACGRIASRIRELPK